MTQIADPAGSGQSQVPADVEDLVLAAGRRIELPGVANLRDVGGYPAADGAVVRWRALFRSDGLHRLEASGLAALAGFSLRTIVDLRTEAETQLAPSVRDGLPARLRHIPVIGGDLQSLPLELPAIYRYLVEQRGDSIAAAIGALCEPAAVPALVHCSAGKDRTGIVIALVLAVLGVPDQVIASDYALSGRYLDPDRTLAIGQLQASTELGGDLTRPLLCSPPELILDVLALVRGSAGSADDYLLCHGLSGSDLARLRSALLR